TPSSAPWPVSGPDDAASHHPHARPTYAPTRPPAPPPVCNGWPPARPGVSRPRATTAPTSGGRPDDRQVDRSTCAPVWASGVVVSLEAGPHRCSVRRDTGGRGPRRPNPVPGGGGTWGTGGGSRFLPSPGLQRGSTSEDDGKVRSGLP